ncbi:MAG: hypothetical protein JNJ60_08705 [Rhodocyclaceae bacterium]|nr:hypothetical protein [Rhodocyclaceae bacterium]
MFVVPRLCVTLAPDAEQLAPTEAVQEVARDNCAKVVAVETPVKARVVTPVPLDAPKNPVPLAFALPVEPRFVAEMSILCDRDEVTLALTPVSTPSERSNAVMAVDPLKFSDVARPVLATVVC